MEIPERLQSGHRGCEAVGGRLLAVGNAVGPGVGVLECLWSRVRAGVLGGRGVPPPPSLKRFPGPPTLVDTRWPLVRALCQLRAQTSTCTKRRA